MVDLLKKNQKEVLRIKYIDNDFEKGYEVNEELIIDENVVKSWFATLEDIANELETEDICFPFDEVMKEDWEFLEHMVLKTNKRCNNTNKYVSKIALKEFMGIQYP